MVEVDEDEDEDEEEDLGGEDLEARGHPVTRAEASGAWAGL